LSRAGLSPDQQHALVPAVPGAAQEVDPRRPELLDGPALAADAALADLLQAFPGVDDMQGL